MESKELLARTIEDLRTDLENTIKEKRELTDPEVLKASQAVDKVLIQYYRKLGM